jgi:serine/threonine protein kinase/Flp pilus assembly protein TadD
MTPERWHRVKELFQSALEREPSQRTAFLDQACAGDDELQKEVESLIATHEKTGSFIDAPAFEAAAQVLGEENPELTPGQRIGHYKILSLLGAGGMGEVYLAQDTRLGRKLALKMLPASFTADQKQVRRFEQEAHAASALNHPNIITIHDIGQIDEIHFIATEYIEGETLRQHMAGKAMRLGEGIDVVIQVASALEAAHQAGIVHRDIKPENIMLRPDGYVKVLDFGLAKLSEGQQLRRDAESGAVAAVKTGSGVVMGTAHYMSPEQARAQAVDARTDIFSLGVVIYEMVTGHVAFEGETPSHVIVAILEKEPPPLVHYVPAVPAELQRIISKALCKDRDERYQTMNDLLVDLKSFRKAIEDGARIETAIALEPASRAWEQVGRVTSSAEYLISGIKRHQKAAALIVAMLVTVLAASAYFQFARSHTTIDSLAALPFLNVGGDPNTEYLSDGITESLINSLSQLPDLKVISFSSVTRYREQQIDPQAVARDLGVRALLVGKVTQRGDDLLVSAELVDTRDNSHIWGEQYNRKLSGLLALQKEISRGISDKLRLRLSGEQKERLTKRYTESTEAFQLYLKGRYHLNKWTPEGWQKSIEYFHQAIEKDPSYAPAYVGVANAYAALGFFDVMLPREARPKAEEAAVKALEIDDTLSEAHTALGVVKYSYDWDFAAAERELKRAIELNPNDEVAHNVYAYYLHSMGRADEGLAEMKRAYELNPLSIRINAGLGDMLAFAHAHRQYDQAIEQFRKTIELEPAQWILGSIYWRLGAVYEKKGMYVEAIAEYQKGMKLSGDSDLAAALEQDYKTSGFREAKRVVLKMRLQKMREASQRERVSPLEFAFIYAELGEKEQAFEWLEKAYEARSGALVHLGDGTVCTCDALRSDPRFADLLRRIGLPPL